MKCGAIVLCGGKSSRMGYSKAMLPFGPERMLQRVVRLVGEVVPRENIVVVAAEGQELPPLPEEITVTHDRQAHRGPLEGLACGLAALAEKVENYSEKIAGLGEVQTSLVDGLKLELSLGESGQAAILSPENARHDAFFHDIMKWLTLITKTHSFYVVYAR